MDIKVLVNWKKRVKVIKGQVQVTDDEFTPEKIKGKEGGEFSIGAAKGKPPNPVTLAGATFDMADGQGQGKEYVMTQVKAEMGGKFPPQCQYEPDPTRMILSQQLRITFTWPDKAAKGDSVTLNHPWFQTFVTDKQTEKGGACAK